MGRGTAFIHAVARVAVLLVMLDDPIVPDTVCRVSGIANTPNCKEIPPYS